MYAALWRHAYCEPTPTPVSTRPPPRESIGPPPGHPPPAAGPRSPCPLYLYSVHYPRCPRNLLAPCPRPAPLLPRTPRSPSPSAPRAPLSCRTFVLSPPRSKNRPKLSLAGPPPLGAGRREIAPPSPPPESRRPPPPRPRPSALARPRPPAPRTTPHQPLPKPTKKAPRITSRVFWKKLLSRARPPIRRLADSLQRPPNPHNPIS